MPAEDKCQFYCAAEFLCEWTRERQREMGNVYTHMHAYLMSIVYMLCSYVMHVCEWESKIWNKNASDFHKIWKEAAKYLWFSSELIGLNRTPSWKGNCLIPNALKIWAHIAFTDVCGFLLFAVPTAQRNSIEFYIRSVFELKIVIKCEMCRYAFYRVLADKNFPFFAPSHKIKRLRRRKLFDV